ncbi:hypothetical protein RJZ90_000513 [Blastomyces dermatitidis]
MGHLLEGDSIIPNKKNATRPWAPSVIKRGDTLYCYYTLSGRGKRDSAIGVATTNKLARGAYWKDHGALIQTETGEGFDVFPFTTSNAIDASVSIDGGKAYLNYGSFFSGIWQVPLGKDLKCLPNSRKLNAVQLARKRQKRNDIEGSFMSFHGGGLGVLTGMNGTPDILYYHYFNAKVSLKHEKARVGYNTLKYVNGWPVVQAPKK